MAQTLEELKAENAQLEEETTEVTPTDAVETDEIGAAEVETEETTDDLGEGAEGVTEETEVEAWMQTDEQASDNAEAKFTGGDIAIAKSKLRGKLEKKHNSEIEELRAQMAQMSQQLQPQAPKQPAQMPTLEQFDFNEPAHALAMQDWNQQQTQASVVNMMQRQAQQQQVTQAQQAIQSQVDQHYERAVTLANESGITPEVYQSSDLMVRQTVEAAMPGKGDAIVDQIIAQMGPGSEKVFFFVGRSPVEQEKLKAKLLADPSGISAALHLGKLAGEKLTPTKRVSRAPKPAAQVAGNTGGSGSASAKKSLKQYEEAHKNRNQQQAYNIKKAAKADGIDTSNW